MFKTEENIDVFELRITVVKAYTIKYTIHKWLQIKLGKAG